MTYDKDKYTFIGELYYINMQLHIMYISHDMQLNIMAKGLEFTAACN